jgi:hypothetical protein
MYKRVTNPDRDYVKHPLRFSEMDINDWTWVVFVPYGVALTILVIVLVKLF